ncbi:MAG: ROK family protein [Chloroflexi bacterium]|nr:ROK family protein [Chloroflexota bacterium]MBP8057912.1 ROK family protein [Chloroflexota bacterium]
MTTLVGGIEAGGTKFVCAVGTGPQDIRDSVRFPTTTPAETIAQAIAFFQQQKEPVAAIGIGSFGPIDPQPLSPTFGFITSTPKPGWANADLVGQIQQAIPVPMAFDTDVNAAAYGEYCWGAAQELDTFLYLTIGTGIGGGGMVEGHLMHGLIHPEMGHILIPHNRADDPYAGHCPFHGDCLEGLASGPAMKARWGQPAETLPPDHPAWVLEANYIAYGLVNLICTLSPQRIILGGGVMSQPHIFGLVRQQVQTLLCGYVQHTAILQEIDQYIVPPALGGLAGVLGSLALGQRLLASA